MTYLAAVLAALLFMLVVRATALPAIAADVMATGRQAARVMRDGGINEAEKERLVQAAALQLMRAFASITGRTVLAIATAVVPLLAFHAAGVAPLASVLGTLGKWQGIVLTGLVMTVVFLVPRRS